jgi:hypothetical protein
VVDFRHTGEFKLDKAWGKGERVYFGYDTTASGCWKSGEFTKAVHSVTEYAKLVCYS